MSETDRKARQLLYCNLMSEIKGRLELVAFSVGSPPFSLAARYEFGYLQLRMICEVIALACLTAHGDVIATKNPRLKEKWRAGEIIKGLEQLHAGFFPVPVDQILDADGDLESIRPLKNKNKYLSKNDLLSLYARCGDILHRGNLNDITPKNVTRDDLLKIAVWHNKILHLLNRHYIEMTDGNAIYIMMQAKETKRVTLLELTRAGDPFVIATPPLR